MREELVAAAQAEADAAYEAAKAAAAETARATADAALAEQVSIKWLLCCGLVARMVAPTDRPL